jgi:hypothetical protein
MHTKEPRTHAAEKVVFKVNLATGHDSYEAWREEAHDDLVLAVSLACWYAFTRRKRREARHTFLR